MHRKHRWQQWLVAPTVGLAALLVAGGVAFATIPVSGRTISGCYSKKGGGLRVIDTAQGQSCRAALEAMRTMQWSPDIVHCNDWHFTRWLRFQKNGGIYKEGARQTIGPEAEAGRHLRFL